MTCNERRDLLVLYAADLLDDDTQREEIRAHVATGCVECADALEEARAMLLEIPVTVDPVTPPPQTLNRLMQRVTAEQVLGRAAGEGRSSAWRVAVAACLGFLIGAAALYFYHVARLNSFNRLLAAEQVVPLKTVGAEASAARGRIFWDRNSGQWHVYVFDLKPLPAGRTYELWFLTKQGTQQVARRAAIFDTDQTGHASVVVQVPADIGPLAAAAITDEIAGGVDQPQGTMHLLGAIE